MVCYDPSPCNSVFDVGFLVHSSSSTTEEKFEMTKSAISEMVGRFDLGPDRVHIGYMTYGYRTFKAMTLDRREQLNKKLTVDKASILPYVPVSYTHLTLPTKRIV